jgi:hypothetical protein
MTLETMSGDELDQLLERVVGELLERVIEGAE